MSFFRYLCRSRRLRCWGSGTWRAPLSLEPLARFVTGGAGARPDHPISRHAPPPEIATAASVSHVALGTAFPVLMFDQLKPLVAAVKKQVPKGAAAKDTSRLLECEERD